MARGENRKNYETSTVIKPIYEVTVIKKMPGVKYYMGQSIQEWTT